MLYSVSKYYATTNYWLKINVGQLEESIAISNIEGKYSSKEWAIAYVETNELILKLNSYIKEQLEDLNYKSTIIPATHNFYKNSLISDWSHRHVGYIAGLGKFGLNSLLIRDTVVELEV